MADQCLIGIFGDDPEFVSQGAQGLRIFALSFPFIGVRLVTGSFFQGIGKGLPSLVLASARDVIFLLPALAIMPRMMGLPGLWTAFAIASVLAALLGIVWTAVQFRAMKMRLHLRQPQAGKPTTAGWET